MRFLSRLRGCVTGGLLLAACAAAPTPSARPLRVRVTDDEGLPLARVPVEIDGISAIKTGSDGTARISLAAHGSPRARIGVTCPASSREAAPRHVPRVVAGGTARLELSFTCRPAFRKLVIVVRAPGAEGLWLRADGEPLGRVGADGTLHAILERAPESDVRLLIDTEERALTPLNPVRVVRVSDRDELVIFAQPLLPWPARGRSSAKRPGALPPPVPYAIRGAGR